MRHCPDANHCFRKYSMNIYTSIEMKIVLINLVMRYLCSSVYLNWRVFVMIEKQAYGSYFLIDKLYFFPYYERSTNFCVTDVSIRRA